MTRLRSYWRWLGHRLRLSQPGRVFFTVALLVGVAGIVVARAHGEREGGAPLVVFALLLIGVVTLDAVGRGVVALSAVSSWTVAHGSRSGSDASSAWGVRADYFILCPQDRPLRRRTAWGFRIPSDPEM